jgi:hypothetical protein
MPRAIGVNVWLEPDEPLATEFGRCSCRYAFADGHERKTRKCLYAPGYYEPAGGLQRQRELRGDLLRRAFRGRLRDLRKRLARFDPDAVAVVAHAGRRMFRFTTVEVLRALKPARRGPAE